MAMRAIDRLQRDHWGCVVLAALVSLLAGRDVALSVVLGGAAISGAALLYTWIFQLALRKQSTRLAILLLFVKLAGFLGLGWWILVNGRGHLQPIGFAIGVTAFPVAAVRAALRGKDRKWNTTDSTGSAC